MKIDCSTLIKVIGLTYFLPLIYFFTMINWVSNQSGIDYFWTVARQIIGTTLSVATLSIVILVIIAAFMLIVKGARRIKVPAIIFAVFAVIALTLTMIICLPNIFNGYGYIIDFPKTVAMLLPIPVIPFLTILLFKSLSGKKNELLRWVMFLFALYSILCLIFSRLAIIQIILLGWAIFGFVIGILLMVSKTIPNHVDELKEEIKEEGKENVKENVKER